MVYHHGSNSASCLQYFSGSSLIPEMSQHWIPENLTLRVLSYLLLQPVNRILFKRTELFYYWENLCHLDTTGILMQSQKFFAISYHNTIFPSSDSCKNIATVPAKTSQVVLSKADNCNSFNGVPDADYVICTTAYLSCSVYKIVNSPLYHANSSRIRSECWALRSTQGISISVVCWPDQRCPKLFHKDDLLSYTYSWINMLVKQKLYLI